MTKLGDLGPPQTRQPTSPTPLPFTPTHTLTHCTYSYPYPLHQLIPLSSPSTHTPSRCTYSHPYPVHLLIIKYSAPTYSLTWYTSCPSDLTTHPLIPLKQCISRTPDSTPVAYPNSDYLILMDEEEGTITYPNRS